MMVNDGRYPWWLYDPHIQADVVLAERVDPARIDIVLDSHSLQYPSNSKHDVFGSSLMPGIQLMTNGDIDEDRDQSQSHPKTHVQTSSHVIHVDSQSYRASSPIPEVPPSRPGEQGNVLAALSIGAPLIASVVVSCLSVMRDEIESVFGDDVRSRPLSAQITVALMWAATVTSLGSTMIAVAGLAMAAGYHDSHVGITKTIIRKIRRKQERMPRALSNIHASDGCQNRAPSPANTFATTFKKERHSLAALRASEVSARDHQY
ncbi:hypothetical protein NLI96_g9972 [Meripilus lineatus]|uniref:Uncharacterized protein n=1 Tax=Meripilus lineatus TaxID=2056292 RepID=A0AAD5UYY8_9APHY|nr:hypothetical protein NLI96_g9972 [Physisporinus lineatus]